MVSTKILDIALQMYSSDPYTETEKVADELLTKYLSHPVSRNSCGALDIALRVRNKPGLKVTSSAHIAAGKLLRELMQEEIKRLDASPEEAHRS